MSDATLKDQAEVAATAIDAQTPSTDATPAAEPEKIADNATTTETATEAKTGETTKSGEKPKEVHNGAAEPASLLKTKNQIDHSDHKKNRKFDPTAEPVTDDPVKIRAQVEFYLSDSNYPTDKFLWETAGGEENKPVSLKTICSFKRMRRFQPYGAIVSALRESNFLDISGEEGEEVVKRKVAYVSSTEAQKKRMAASIYVKGFGDETGSTQYDLETFFSEYGTVKLVKLRRTAEDLFKGSVFVEFESEEQANAFVKLDPAATWEGHELKIMKKADYLAEKNQLIAEGKLEPSNARRSVFFEGKEKGRSNARARGNRGNHSGKNDSSDWKKRRDDDQQNGFKNFRGRGGRGGRGNRGGRGRGGRGNGRDRDQGRRDDNTKVEAAAPQSNNNVRPPMIQTTNEKGNIVKNGESNGKRAREDDGASAPPAKKVDAKAVGTAQ